MNRNLEDLRILVVEDDFFAALEVQQFIEDLGGAVVGPAGRIEEALKAIDRSGPVDGAVLDINLDGETTYDLARDLLGAGVAVVFLTGYDASTIAQEFRDVPRIGKPFDERKGERMVREVFGRRQW